MFGRTQRPLFTKRVMVLACGSLSLPFSWLIPHLVKLLTGSGKTSRIHEVRHIETASEEMHLIVLTALSEAYLGGEESGALST